jgi:hypothetical protein
MITSGHISVRFAKKVHLFTQKTEVELLKTFLLQGCPLPQVVLMQKSGLYLGKTETTRVWGLNISFKNCI